jgi:hypothetical protein
MTEAQFCSWFATPQGYAALTYMAQRRLAPADVLRLIAKARRDVWRDLSSPSGPGLSLGCAPASSPSSGSTES